MDKKYPLIFSVILLMFACLCVNQESAPEPLTTLVEEASVPTTTSLLQTEEKTTTSEAAKATTTVTDTTREVPKTADLYYRDALRSYDNRDYESAMEQANLCLHEYNQTGDRNGVLKCSALINEINKHKKDIEEQSRAWRMLEGNETQAIENPAEAYENVRKAVQIYRSLRITGLLPTKEKESAYLEATELARLANSKYAEAGNQNGTYASKILMKDLEELGIVV